MSAPAMDAVGALCKEQASLTGWRIAGNRERRQAAEARRDSIAGALREVVEATRVVYELLDEACADKAEAERLGAALARLDEVSR